MKQYYLLLLGLLGLVSLANAQFTPIGTATQTSNSCFTLTQNQSGQGGAIYHTQRIDLTRRFDVFGQVFLGCFDGNGADGITFLMIPTTGGIGATGGGMGYQGLTPSLGVEFDTWQNTNKGDPVQDHLAVISNGNNDHTAATSLAGPVSIYPSGANAEICNFINFQISWDPVTDSLKVWVNCNLRLAYQGDIVNTIFGGNSEVFWGFTSSTGLAGNVHQVCINYFNNYRPATICEGASVNLSAGPGTNFTWTPAAGLSSTNTQNVVATPDTTTTYTVTVDGPCAGATRTRTWDIFVDYDSVLNIDLGPDTAICSGQGIQLDAFRPGPTYLWMDGLTDSSRFVTQGDTFWVELSNACGQRRDTVIVSEEITPIVDLGNDTTLCFGDAFTLDATNSNASYLWQDNSTDSTFTLTNPGIYWAQASNICGTDRDSIIMTYIGPPQPFSLGNDTILCDNATLTLDASQPNVNQFLWQNNSTQPTFTVQTTGDYFVTLTNQCGSLADTIRVDYDQFPEVDLGPDTTLCAGTPYLLDATWTPFSTYNWQNNSTAPVFTVVTAGNYTVTVQNSCGTANDAVRVSYLNPPIDPDLGEDTVLCGNATLLLDPGLAGQGYTFLWQDGSTNPTFTARNQAAYSVQVRNRCGMQQDTIQVRYDSPPNIDFGNDSTLCEGESILLNAIWSRATYLWSDGFTGPLRTIDASGTYQVTVTNLCGTDQEEINLNFVPYPQAVDLGPDQILCDGETLLLTAEQPGFNYVWQDGSQEATFLVRFAGTYSVSVGNGCGEEVDQIRVDYADQPVVNLGEDQILCLGQTLRLDATSPSVGVSYTWENGTTAPVRSVTEEGRYAVLVENACGIETDTVEVVARNCDCQVFVPSGFTPNDDGVNDDFTWGFDCDLQTARLRIFDRWGRLMFETDSPDQGWDGRLPGGSDSPEGVYVWVLEYVFQGAGSKAAEVTESGTVTVIR